MASGVSNKSWIETISSINRKNRNNCYQNTISAPISCSGVGLHSGVPVSINLLPSSSNTGIVFKRVDLIGGGTEIKANWSNISDSRMCTIISAENGISVATVEHLLAAFYAKQIDNVIVEVNGPEIPAMDGSASPFIFLIECAGIQTQRSRRKYLRILKPVVYKNGDKEVGLTPADRGLTVEFYINFSAPAVGKQSCQFDMNKNEFLNQVSKARTFGFLSDVTALREAGLARGGSLDNAIVVDSGRILNEDGLRHDKEFVHHKALDAVGDLYLTGYQLIGHFHGICSSHADTANLLRKVFANNSNWELVDSSQNLSNISEYTKIEQKIQAIG